MRAPQVPGPRILVGALAFAVGCFWVALDSGYWYLSQQFVAIHDQESIMALVLRYYVTEALAICIVIVGAYLIFEGIRSSKGGSELDSIKAILADALSSRRDFYVGVVAAILYGLVYLFVSGVVVFQPDVDFGATYGVTSPGWTATACCGSPGTVPALVVYLAPQAHLALLILPLDLLFAVVVPLLVGLNTTVVSYAIRNRNVRSDAGWMGSVGLLAGLFTGCPTCAGLFLAGAAGGLGATTLAIALAPYQLLFVLVSLPLLAMSPPLIAYYAQRAMRAACAVPALGDSPPSTLSRV